LERNATTCVFARSSQTFNFVIKPNFQILRVREFHNFRDFEMHHTEIGRLAKDLPCLSRKFVASLIRRIVADGLNVRN
jgi:hypothetical protein